MFNFLSRIKTTLNNLWGNTTGVNPETQSQPLSVKSPVPQSVAQSPVPTTQSQSVIPPSPEPTAAPGLSAGMNFVANQIPPSQQATTPPASYYPALADKDFVNALIAADAKRQGLGSLLLLQALFESGLGRANNGNNIFGAMPGGENGEGASFSSPTDALDYQLSPHVLGGGANPNMNILSSSAPLTQTDVSSLYDSYNPNSPYLETLLSALFPKGR